MTMKFLTSAAAIVALATAGPALSKPGGGHGAGGAKAGTKAGVGAGAGGGADVGAMVGSPTSRGGAMPGGISATGRGSANAKAGFGSAIDMRGSTSARASGKAAVGTQAGISAQAGLGANLTGVETGMTVVDSGGATVGTVTGIQTVGNGKVRSVQVTLTDGSIITLASRGLTVDGDALVTSSLTTNVKSQGANHANINGLIHASPRSALARAGVTSLTGLAAGLTVNNTGGTSIGTVSSIVTNTSGAVVGINVALEGGGTVFIPATSLSISGGVVTTTFVVPGG
jgi:hypothetical protein